MPGLNQTGPAGMGPMTGWGRGVCQTEGAAYGAGSPANTGFGRGRGLGRGFRRGFGAGAGFGPARGSGRGRAMVFQAYPEDGRVELGRLKDQAAGMQRSLDAINQRIAELEKSE